MKTNMTKAMLKAAKDAKRKKTSKALVDLVKSQDANSGVSESEYKASMKRSAARKEKNAKEFKKQNY